jgi:ATP-binding cassette subfamily F protein 3
VSHDRYFISRVANRIVELRDGELVLYRGDYAYYQEKKREEAGEAEARVEEQRRLDKREANRTKQQQRKSARRGASEPEGAAGEGETPQESPSTRRSRGKVA